MASLFFKDYHFPVELYNKETGDFTTPIRTLLDFTPHILKQLPKKEKDQEPIQSTKEDAWTNDVTPKPQSILSNVFSTKTVGAVTEFIMKCGHDYIKMTKEEERIKRYEDLLYSSSDEEDKRKKQNLKSKAANKKKKTEDSSSSGSSRGVMIKSAASVGILSLSLYSTYQASVQWSDISFHNQLQVLIEQVKSILQSTDIWIQEHDAMGDPVPEQVRKDMVELNQLLDLLVRLDPRSNKKIEAVGWGAGAVGGLSALGGLALGSATAMTGGAALVVGGAVVMISSKASSKSHLAARLQLENKVREKVANCQYRSLERERIIERGFIPNISVEEDEFVTEPLLSEPSVKKEPTKKQRQPLHSS